MGRLRVRVGFGGWSPLMRDAHEWQPAAYTPPVREKRVRMGHPKF